MLIKMYLVPLWTTLPKAAKDMVQQYLELKADNQSKSKEKHKTKLLRC